MSGTKLVTAGFCTLAHEMTAYFHTYGKENSIHTLYGPHAGKLVAMGMLANKAKFFMRQSMLYAQLPAVWAIVDQGGD